MAIFGTQNLRARLIQAARAATSLDLVYVLDPQFADGLPNLANVTVVEVQADFIVLAQGAARFLVPIDKIVTIDDPAV
ncbi:hypothetical protein [Fictibacillus sp. 26RED30]|uniref:hypothetical protein n=1 Tax=unclassified Fictibacillus TaxID=2644029 RepID=UPI0018CFD5B3|nr:hypothetical protein [Fictibacillus sp. 26RED30]MBH0161192.1 hypothetical protein [Fictibacillus sp. 26RED30]